MLTCERQVEESKGSRLSGVAGERGSVDSALSMGALKFPELHVFLADPDEMLS